MKELDLEIDDDAVILMKGSTLNYIIDVINENRVVMTGKKQYDEEGPEGSKVSLDDPSVGIADIGDFAEGETDVSNVKKISFSPLFKIHNNGDGNVVVDLKTEECECDDGTIDGGTT